MSKAIILQHVEHEGPGRIVPVLRDYGIPTEVRRLYQGDEVPADLDELRLLVVMGGPMGVSDIGSEQYPFLAQEVELIRRLAQLDHPMLGICLGAQLLAHAAGAKVYPNTIAGPTPESPRTPAPEIGWGLVQFPFPGGTEPITMGLMDGAPMFHWHFDTFDLPRLPAPTATAAPAPPAASAVLISSTKTCKNQVYRYRNRLFGFQYHVEMEPDGIEGMLTHGAEDVAKVLGPDGAAKIREDTARFYPRYQRLGERVLRNFVQFLKLY